MEELVELAAGSLDGAIKFVLYGIGAYLIAAILVFVVTIFIFARIARRDRW